MSIYGDSDAGSEALSGGGAKPKASPIQAFTNLEQVSRHIPSLLEMGLSRAHRPWSHRSWAHWSCVPRCCCPASTEQPVPSDHFR